MLRIRNDVDLKELEKFGFFREESFYGKEYYIYKEEFYHIEISYDDRIIAFVCYVDFDFYAPEVLYDLTKAELVEKVSD